VPFLILSVVLAGREIIAPSGAWTVAMPTGTSAWKPDRVAAADKAIVSNLIAEQKALGISSPEGFVVVGVPLQVERQPDGSWTKFQLRDGRDVIVIRARAAPREVNAAIVKIKNAFTSIFEQGTSQGEPVRETRTRAHND
jgi:hypothetical protein